MQVEATTLKTCAQRYAVMVLIITNISVMMAIQFQEMDAAQFAILNLDIHV